MNHRRYNIVFSALLAGALFVIAGVNIAADPYGAYPSVHVEKVARMSNAVGTRTARAELLRHGPWEFIVLGSSRSQMGYDPEYAALGGVRGSNVAVPGTNIRELQPILNYALRHNDPDRVFFGIDFVLFTTGRDFNQDFAQSRFAPGRDLVSYHLDNTVSLRASFDTMQSFQQIVQKKEPRFSPNGQTRFEPNMRGGGRRKLIKKILSGFFTNPESYGNYHYDQDRLDRFKLMIAAARDEGVALDIVFNPMHAAQMEAVHVAGLWPIFEQWVTDVADIVAEQKALPGGERIRLMSFLGYGPYRDEPIPPFEDTESDMQWWWESSHFKNELGLLVLDWMYEDPADRDAAFGVELSPALVDGHLGMLQSGRERWLNERPDEASFVRDVAREVGAIE